MPKFFVSSNQINHDTIKIEGGDVNHIINVLRMKTGEKLQICDLDNGTNYLCHILDYNKEKVVCKIIQDLVNDNETKIDITLFQGIPKFDKMEFIIQKNTEIGVKTIVPVSMKRCIAKIKDSSKIERWNKIAGIAAKQSMRNKIPVVEQPINVKEMCNRLEAFDIVFLAYECEQDHTLKRELKKLEETLKKDENEGCKIGVIIGPEGGVDSEEIEQISQCSNVKIITLGKRILRTETAGLVLASNIIYELDS